jgi:hypothetical protein
MTINPVLAQWDRNEQTQFRSSDHQTKRWLREVGGDDAAVQPNNERRWWPALALALGGLSALAIIL